MENTNLRDTMAKVLTHCGMSSLSELAKTLGVSRQYLHAEIKRGRLSPKVIASIHRLTNGTFGLRELRPDLYEKPISTPTSAERPEHIARRDAVSALLARCGLSSFSDLAREAGLTAPAFARQVQTGRFTPAVIATIDRLSGGQVTMQELRPDLFQ